MKQIYSIALIIAGCFLFYHPGHTQQTKQKSAKCMVGFIDSKGNACELEGKQDYYLELLPGMSFTGSWYYGTNSDSISANLIEIPEVDWLQITPSQFVDIGDGIATKVDYVFTIPFTTGLLTTTIIDQDTNWTNMFVSVLVTNYPSLNLEVFDEQINTYELFEDSFQYGCPSYFYWSSSNQYYYINQMGFNLSEHPEKSWFNIQPNSFVLLPDETNTVTLTANIPTPGIDSLIISEKMQLYGWPSYYQYNFDVTASPYLQVTPATRNVTYLSGNTTFDLISNVSWSVIDDASWLTVVPVNGSNNATLTATFSENTTGISRLATITITGTDVPLTTVHVSQAANPALTVTPANQNVSASAGTTSFSVTSNTTWAVTENVSWLSVTPMNGTFNGTLTVNFNQNTTGSTRTGQITITGSGGTPVVNVTVTQEGSCSFSITPANRNVSFPAGSTTFTITSNTSWTVTDDVSWMAVAPAGNTGNGTITAYYSQNNFTAHRIGTITISACGIDHTVTVTQDPAPCQFSITPASDTVEYTSVNIWFTIASNTLWSVSDDADWLTVSPTTGTQNYILTATCATNTSSLPRIGTIDVYACDSTYTVTVVQNGMSTPDVISLNPGWNLISFDVSLNPDTPDVVFQPLITSANLEIVTGFQNQIGVFYDPDGLPILNTLQHIVAGEGYWVKVINPATLTVYGDLIQPSFDMNLSTGWNLIAWPWSNTPPETAFSNLNPSCLLMVTGFDLQGTFYNPFGPPFLNTLDMISNGFGYWVKVSCDCTLSHP